MKKILLGIVGVSMVLVGVAYLCKSKNAIAPSENVASSTVTATAPSAATPSSASSTDSSDWVTYKNPTLGFQISYPSGFRLTESRATYYRPDDYHQFSVSDNNGHAYVSIGVLTSTSSDERSLFSGPYPKTVSGGREANPYTVVERSLNGMQGIEEWGGSGGGLPSNDRFEYLNRYIWDVDLNIVLEGHASVTDLDLIASLGTQSKPDESIYRRILDSIRIY